MYLNFNIGNTRIISIVLNLFFGDINLYEVKFDINMKRNTLIVNL